MDPIRLLLRSKRLAQHPPSMRRVVVYAGVIAASLAVAGIERLWGWPDWLTVDSLRAKP